MDSRLNTKITKFFIYLIVLLSIFVCDNVVYAATTQQINVCTDRGYAFLIEYEGTNKNIFYDINGNDTNLTKNLYGKENKNGSFNYGGVVYNYSYIGDYNKFGKAENTSRCFKTVDKQATSSIVTGPNSESSSSSTRIYTNADWCGEVRVAGSNPFIVKEVKQTSNSTGAHQVIFELANNDSNTNILNLFWDNVIVTGVSYKGVVTNSLNVTKRISAGKKQIVVSGIIPPNYKEDPTLEITVAVKVDEAGQIFSKNITLKKGNYAFGTDNYASDSGEISLTQLKRFCGNTLYVGSVSTFIPFDTNVNVNNPYLSDSSCANIKSFTKATSDFKKKIASECYDSKVTLDTVRSNTITSNTIKQKYQNLEDLYGNKEIRLTQLIGVEKLDCTNGFLGVPSSNDKLKIPFETKITYEETGTYWSMVCKEEYYIQSDSPQLVQAGMGVHYNNVVEVIKTCSIINTNKVTKKPQCSVNVSDVNCHYDVCTYCDDSMRDRTWTNPETVGPNHDFDECIASCDGGLYTQSCVNKCYSEVYDSDRNLPSNGKVSTYTNKVDKFGYKANDSGNSQSGTCSALVTGLQDSSCFNNSNVSVNFDCVSGQSCNGKPNCCYVKVNGTTQKEIGVSNYCAGTANSNLSGNHITTNHGSGSLCDYSYSVGPSGCSWNSEGEYQAGIAASKSELAYFQNLAQKKSEIKDYTIEIKDSKTNVVYSVSGSTSKPIEDKPSLIINYEEEVSKNETSNKKNKLETVQIGTGGDSTNYYKNYTNVTVYTISLPIQYVNNGDYTNVVVKNNLNNNYYNFDEKNTSVVNEQKNYKFKEYKGFKPGVYTNGENVYYTPFYGPEVNVSTEVDEAKINEIDLQNYEKAYLLYVVNNEKILKQLEFTLPNINVHFTIDTVGSENVNKGNAKVNSFTANAGYICYYGITNVINKPEDSNIDKFIPDDGDKDVTENGSGSNGGSYSEYGDGSGGLRYYYREIYLEPNKNGYGGVFPNNRKPRWNWTGTISNGTVTGAADNSDPSYLVDPERLIKDIEKKGDSIFTTQAEYDYEFTLTRAMINEIRRYNDNKKITYLDFSIVAGSTAKKNYSQKIKDWFNGQSLYSQAYSITECNNAISGRCDN